MYQNFKGLELARSAMYPMMQMMCVDMSDWMCVVYILTKMY